MTIQRTLMLLTFVLVVIIAVLASRTVFEEKANYDNARFAQETSPIIENLLSSASKWAVERGVSNAGLNGVDPAKPETLSTIGKMREDGDKGYKTALEALEKHAFSSKDELIGAVEAAYAKVTAIRSKVDQNLGLSKIKRDVVVMNDVVPTISNLIISSQELRFAVAAEFSGSASTLASQSQLKHFAWIMSEYAGRERAIIGGLISANTAFSSDKLEVLAEYQGRRLDAWSIVQKLAKNSNSEQVRTAVKKAGEHYFDSFQELRKAIFKAGNEGEAYPVNAAEWIKQSTAAIDSLLEIQAASAAETVEFLETEATGQLRHVLINLAILIAAVLIGGIAFVVISKKVVSPIRELTAAMSNLSSGNTTVKIPSTTNTDEIGFMAKAVEVFKQKMIDNDKMKEEQVLEQVEKEKRMKVIEKLINDFDSKAAAALDEVASAATELNATATFMNGVVETTNTKSRIVAEASESASANVQTIASAAEELSASIQEIGRQVASSTTITKEAVSKAEGADEIVQSLSEAAVRVGEVVGLISDIAEQINLLALNATIESARAGDAGKGFAVVASEVKNLAGQTSKATEDIAAQVSNIQNVAKTVVSVLNSIKDSIKSISDISGSISAGVEEQGSATREIAANVQTAAGDVRQVDLNIKGVSQASEEADESAKQVVNASGTLSKEAETLRADIQEFLRKVKAA